MNLKQALATLDPSNEDHWTLDGLPRVDVASEAMRREVTRRQITDAMPNLTRETYASEFPPIGHEPEGDPSPKTPDPAPTAEPGNPEPAPPTEPEAEPESAPTPEPATEPEAEPAPEDVPPPVEPGTEGVEPPAEEPATSAYVEPHDDVVGMGVTEVFKNIDLVDRAIAEFGRQAEVLSARREAVVSKLKEVGQRSAMLDRARTMLLRAGARPTATSPIQAYQRQQLESRKKRALAAQKFIAAGTTADDVVEQLEGPSKIDASMKSRRKRGGKRPAYPSKI